MKQLYLSLILLWMFALTTKAQPKNEIRATWLTTIYGLDWPATKATSLANINKQKAELCQILDELKAANFNTVLLQTRLRGDVIYPSTIEPFNEMLTGKSSINPGYDPLAFAIEECHKRGLECHAWLVSIPLGKDKHVKDLGRNSITKKRPKICKRYMDEWFLDPGNPETKEYLLSIVNEIVTRYDVDGIHLDYIRYPDRPKGFPDQEMYRKYGAGKSLESWRRENITAIVRHLYKAVKDKKPWIKMSSSPIGKFKDTSHYPSGGWNSYYAVYQDAQGWLKEGIQDILFPMMYFNGNNFYPFALDWQEQRNNRFVVPGLGIYFLDPIEKNWDLSEIERQIYFTRAHGLAGQAYYRTKYILNNTKRLLDELHGLHYAYPALQPAMVWMQRSAPSAPKELLDLRKGDTIRLSWSTSSNSNFKSSPYYIIYGSNSYPVDITRPENIIAQRVQGNQYLYSEGANKSVKKYFAVTAMDRYGNESSACQLSITQNKFEVTKDGNLILLPISNNFVDVTFIDVLGKCVLSSPYKESIVVNTLPKGIYRILFTDKAGKVHPSTKILAR